MYERGDVQYEESTVKWMAELQSASMVGFTTGSDVQAVSLTLPAFSLGCLFSGKRKTRQDVKHSTRHISGSLKIANRVQQLEPSKGQNKS